MFNHKLNLTERSHVAEELLPANLSEVQRKCAVIQQVVADGDFSLEEALEIYEIDMLDYFKFANIYMVTVLKSMIGKTKTTKN